MRNRGTTSFTSGHGRLWEFPLTVNYYLGRRHARPYVGGGIVLSQDLTGTIDFITTGSSGEVTSSFTEPIRQFRPKWPSIIADVGLEFSRSRFRLRPELRYTRHRPDEFIFGVPLHSDQIDLLLGLSFQKQ
jgi:hypothetical protein